LHVPELLKEQMQTIISALQGFYGEDLKIHVMTNQAKFKNVWKSHAAGTVAMMMFMFAVIVSCEKEGGPSGYNPPADHTISNDGYMHKSGLDDPLANCVDCHGADLKGGSVGVSCYECHGQKW
jgi:hypothetical protein